MRESKASNDFAVSPPNQGRSPFLPRQQTWNQGMRFMWKGNGFPVRSRDTWEWPWSHGLEHAAGFYNLVVWPASHPPPTPEGDFHPWIPGRREQTVKLREASGPGSRCRAGKGAFSAWLPAGIPVGRKKRVDQESREEVRQGGEKSHRCPKFPQFYQKSFHDSSRDFSPNLIW